MPGRFLPDRIMNRRAHVVDCREGTSNSMQDTKAVTCSPALSMASHPVDATPRLDDALAAILNAVRQVVREELNHVLSRLAPARPNTLNSEEAALLLDVKPKTVRKWVAEGRLPARKQGRYLRLLLADVEKGPIDPQESVADQLYEHLRKSHVQGLVGIA